MHSGGERAESAVCYRVAKTHRIPYLYRSFSAKSPIFSGSFWKMICNLGDPKSLRHPVGGVSCK